MKARKKTGAGLVYSSGREVVLSHEFNKLDREDRDHKRAHDHHHGPHTHPEYYEQLVAIQEMNSYYASRNQ